MIQLNYLLKRRSDLSDADFQAGCQTYLTLVEDLRTQLGFDTAQFSSRLDTPYQECMRGAHYFSVNQFDALMTLEWPNWQHYTDAAGQPDGLDAHDQLAAIESRYFDRTRSQIVLTEAT